MIKQTIFITILFSVCLFGQAFRLSKPSLNDSTVVYEGLGSNGITKIAFQGDSLIWFATGGGLSKTTDFGETFSTYYSGLNNLPRGGISAIAIQDSIIWVAGVFDSTTTSGDMQTGGGLAYSKNYGESWTYIPQPIDSSNDKTDIWNGDTVAFLPITTPVNNTTWDISITPIAEDSVWAVSYTHLTLPTN